MTNTLLDNPTVSDTPAATVQRMTTAEFALEVTKPEFRGRQFELVNGRMVEKAVPNAFHSAIIVELAAYLRTIIRPNGLGWLMTDVDVILPVDQDNWTRPDIAFVAKAQGQFDWDKPLPFMPWFMIEIKSPGNTYIELRQKALYFLARNAKLVWLIFPERETIEVYALDDLIVRTYDDVLTGGDLLPDLSLTMRALVNALKG
jgi:Uma2 family endonuclease